MARNRIGMTVCAAAAAGALVFVGSGPANAQNLRKYLGDNYASIETATHPWGRWVEVCDMERDGNGVFAKFFNPEDFPSVQKVGDGNGSKAGCGNANVRNSTYGMQVCEEGTWGISCSAIKDV
ncbi:hypothetical protein B4N89_30430 [Embleya scabrispora]|uniref:Uncharacterized protein n=1 Tax=Embleya scabrispora TaxID=159449 RepID=A0A1T3P6H2_9ACTN|nr:hypothetical protein [Embleya scabrispora]OPC84664.1 hypothetical protein B4N89_30430 [Embleya scabrispora]